MGQYVHHSPEEIFARLVRGEAAEAANRTIIHAGTVFHCTGQLMTQYAPAMFFEVPYANLQFIATHILNHATEYPQAKLHECLCCYFNFKKMCWCDCLNIYQTHRIKALIFEIAARWDPALESIEQAARANNQSAKWVVGTAQLNQCTIYQHYAMHMQDLLHPASIEDMIHWTFGFEDGPLFDSPGNIQQINAIQDAYTGRDLNP